MVHCTLKHEMNDDRSDSPVLKSDTNYYMTYEM